MEPETIDTNPTLLQRRKLRQEAPGSGHRVTKRGAGILKQPWPHLPSVSSCGFLWLSAQDLQGSLQLPPFRGKGELCHPAQVTVSKRVVTG